MAEFKSIRDLLLATSPGWLLRPKGGAWLAALGECQERVVRRVREACEQRFSTIAGAAAQAKTAAERLLERGPDEENAAFGLRLSQAWTLWRWGGTAKGVLRALSDAGYPTAMLATATGHLYALEGQAVSWYEKLDPRSSFACVVTGSSARAHLLRLVVTDNDGSGTLQIDVICDGVLLGNYEFEMDELTPLEIGPLSGVSVTISGSATYPLGGETFFAIVGPAHEGVYRVPLAAGSWEMVDDVWSKFVVLFPTNPFGYGVRPRRTDPRVETIFRLANRWKPAVASCRAIVVADRISSGFFGGVWGYPPSLWGESAYDVWGGAFELATSNSGGLEVCYGDSGGDWSSVAVGTVIYNGVVSDGLATVLVGDAEMAWTSGNLSTWHVVTAGLAELYWDVCRTDNNFVAVGAAAHALSDDGVSWTEATDLVHTYLACCWTGRAVVAVGHGYVARSADEGETWHEYALTGDWEAVATSGAEVVAVSSDGKVARSTDDGVTWTVATLSGGTWYAIAWNGSVYAVVGAGTDPAAVSPDGITWTTGLGMAAGDFYAVIWDGRQFLAVGDSNTAISVDGTTWTLWGATAGGDGSLGSVGDRSFQILD